jgi:two-component system sensor histidine kinase CpxA
MAKVLGLLFLHLSLLALGFLLFVRWQLDMGLGSFLSESNSGRLRDFGDLIAVRMEGKSPQSWPGIAQEEAEKRGLTAIMLNRVNFQTIRDSVPENVRERLLRELPGRGMRQGGRLGGPPPPGPRTRERMEGMLPDFSTPEGEIPPLSRPLFLVRGDGGSDYWAGLALRIEERPRPGNPGMAVLLLKSERLDGGGLFFDFRPWLWGGLVVLSLSLLFWAPFVWKTTRYIRSLTDATRRVSEGVFSIAIPKRNSDELADLGHSIEVMADRLSHMVQGQKRFLGDAAHELCAPLARIRTALSVLEQRIDPASAQRLESINEDASELANLVDEILAFTRAGNRPAHAEPIDALPFLERIIDREAGDSLVRLDVPEGMTLHADPRLLGRAIGNLLRNAAIHAGPSAKVLVELRNHADHVSMAVTDSGPGVPREELGRIFEAFHRLDRSRSRDTGGSGLGLAIVRSAVEACGGSVSAELPHSGGLCVRIKLPVAGS